MLSPSSAATFSAQVAPVTRNERTELWHARLAARSSGDADQHPGPVPFRAVWSPDLPVPGGSPLPGTGFPAGNAGTTTFTFTVSLSSPYTSNQTVEATSVTLVYPYKWQFNTVVVLMVPGASYSSTTPLTTVSVMQNMN